MRRFEGGEGAAERRLPVGFLAVVGVDLFIDGLLVGIGAAVSTETATIIAVALTVEVLSLGLSVALQLRWSGNSGFVAAVITAGLSLLVALGAILGALGAGRRGRRRAELGARFRGRRAVVVGRRGTARRGSRDAGAALDNSFALR